MLFFEVSVSISLPKAKETSLIILINQSAQCIKKSRVTLYSCAGTGISCDWMRLDAQFVTAKRLSLQTVRQVYNCNIINRTCKVPNSWVAVLMDDDRKLLRPDTPSLWQSNVCPYRQCSKCTTKLIWFGNYQCTNGRQALMQPDIPSLWQPIVSPHRQCSKCTKQNKKKVWKEPMSWVTVLMDDKALLRPDTQEFVTGQTSLPTDNAASV